ncbi:hypothetical protein DFH09DRAFT_1478827 [Mycena vulgaris]|nr:hypothetical protein DFH09DRAFT_1478827 [Mycena vulgaris]
MVSILYWVCFLKTMHLCVQSDPIPNGFLVQLGGKLGGGSDPRSDDESSSKQRFSSRLTPATKDTSSCGKINVQSPLLATQVPALKAHGPRGRMRRARMPRAGDSSLALPHPGTPRSIRIAPRVVHLLTLTAQYLARTGTWVSPCARSRRAPLLLVLPPNPRASLTAATASAASPRGLPAPPARRARPLRIPYCIGASTGTRWLPARAPRIAHAPLLLVPATPREHKESLLRRPPEGHARTSHRGRLALAPPRRRPRECGALTSYPTRRPRTGTTRAACLPRVGARESQERKRSAVL